MIDNQHRPKVSVCMPSYNHDQFIGEAIASIINQTFTDWELVISDDASPDNSVEIMRSYQQQYPDKIRIIENTENGGPSINGNRAINAACGEYLAYLCSDDRMKPERLQTQVDYLDSHQDVGIVFTDVGVINQEGIDLNVDTLFSKSIDELWWQLLGGNFLNAPSAMLRRSLYQDIGDHNPGLLYVQDFDYWLRTLDKYKIDRLPQKLTEYRQHGSNLSMPDEEDSLPYAGTYETVFVILRAIKRYDVLLKDKPLSVSEIIDKKYELARRAKRAEQNFLSSFKYSLEMYYLLALDILELDETQVQARQMLQEVYKALGDHRRAHGGRSISMKEYRYEGGVLDKAKQAHELLGGNLFHWLKTIIDEGKSGHLSEREKDDVYCLAIEFVIKELQTRTTITGQESLSCPYGKIDEFANALSERLLRNPEFNKGRELLLKLKKMEETYLYREWIAMHQIREIDGQLFAERMMLQWKVQPVFHLVLFVFAGEQHLLADTIDSLSGQMYAQWQFSVISDVPSPDVMFEDFPNLQWLHIATQGNPYDVLNEVVQQSSADWVSVIQPGAMFQAQTLIRFGDYINLHPECLYFYADEDTVDDQGNRQNPQFKPDFNLDLLRSEFYIGTFAVINREAVNFLGGFQATPDMENYDMAFKFFERYGQKVFCHIADVLYHAPEHALRRQDYAVKKVIVENHLLRSAIAAEVVEGYLPGTHHVNYFHETQPLVSIIIPTRDKIELFKPCIESLMSRTDYPNVELIVVNNQSKDPDILDYFAALPGLYPGQAKVLDYPHDFNYAAISNLAVENSAGEFIVFLNNDTEVIQGHWLDRMLAFGMRADVGIVGARLTLPESAVVQHVGVVLGMTGVADHPYSGVLDLRMPGHMGRALLDQNYSAVTAGCMLVKKSLYLHVAGMDEDKFPILFNDVDLCLKVNELGYRTVWTPTVTLVHHLSASLNTESDEIVNQARRKLNKRSQDELFLKWRHIIANDPAYNRNLSLIWKDCRVDVSLPVNWDVNFHERERLLGLPLPGGAGDYRIILPLDALSKAGKAQGEYVRLHGGKSRPLTVSEAERLAPDSLIVQSAINHVELEFISALRRLKPELFIVFSLDDLITAIPEKSSAHLNFMKNYRDAKQRLRKVLQYCDRLVVSTEPLAEFCQDMIDDIKILPNCLSKETWSQLSSLRGQGEKPRVGWAGAQQHQGDLEIILEVVKETADEIDWIFMGMCPPEIEHLVKEYRGYVSFDEYPQQLASMNLDLAIAPLENCQFNDAKSNLRLLEYGALGWPVICSDVIPYQTQNPPVIRVENTKNAWLNAIRDSLADVEQSYQQGDQLKQWVLDNFMLEDRLDPWLTAFSRGK